jgi:hypothetical protein
MKIEIEEIKTYRISANGQNLGNFTLDSKWNGLACLKQGPNSLIVQDPEKISTGFDTAFGSIFGDIFKSNPNKTEVSVISGSPSLISKLVDPIEAR